MSIIEFPNNSEGFAKLGEEALAAGDQIKALHLFQKSYQLQPSFSLNYLIVNLMMEVGEAESALKFTEDWLEKYFSKAEYLTVYFQLLLQNHQFLKARKILHQGTLLEKDELTILSNQLNELEHYVREYERLKINKILQQLTRIHELTAVEQTSLIKKMNQLPFADFCLAAKDLLVNEQLVYLTRVKIVEELVRLQVSENYELLWFDGTIKTFIPKHLSLPEKDSGYLKVRQVLVDSLEHDDPVSLAAILEEVRLHFAILYPFAEGYLIDPILWGKSYLVDYQLATDDYLEESPDFAEIQKHKENLRCFLLQLMSNNAI